MVQEVTDTKAYIDECVGSLIKHISLSVSMSMN